jgi:hypothetical protein
VINATSDSLQPSTAGPRVNPEVAVRVVNALVAVELGRLPHPTHLARIKELEAAGAVPDEAAFPRLASGLPR